MDKLALWVELRAKPGKENEVAEFLTSALPLIEAEPDTSTWFALKLGPSNFGIFETFTAESGRQAHLSGEVAAALKEKAPDLLAEPPRINKLDLLAAKSKK